MKKLFNQSGNNVNYSNNKVIVLFITFITFIFINAGFGQISGWDFSTLTGGANNFGPSPYDATTHNTNITVGGLTRGAGCGSTGTGAAHAWGANGYTNGGTFAGEVAADKYWTFTISANTGYKVSVSGIGAYNIRRSGTGPSTGQWQYKVGSGSFVNIGSEITWGSVTSSSGNPQTLIDLSTITDLQNVVSGTTITFRIVCYGASSTTGTCYFNDPANTTDNDLVINGTVLPVGGTSPLVTTQSVSAIDTTFATGNGNITNIGSSNIITSGICLDTISGPTILSYHTTDGPTGNFTGAYTSSITGLSVNKHYYAKAYATNSNGPGYGTETNFWTLAKKPLAPTVNNPTVNSLDVKINENGNPANTVFAVQEVGGQFVQANGTLGANIVWQASALWGTKTVTGLSANTIYSFKVKAKNGADVETEYSPSFGDTTLILSGTNPISGTVPNNYDLLQNYPNPFNPITTISFQIPNSGLTTLKIYNVLGKEVATLVNGFLQAGYYKNSFSSDEYKLSSGIYFYKLTSGSFSKIMKLALIK